MPWVLQLAKEVREHRSEMLRQTPSGIHFFDHEITESSALVLPSFEGSTQLRSVVLSQLENAHVQREAEREGIINRPAIHPFTSHQVELLAINHTSIQRDTLATYNDIQNLNRICIASRQVKLAAMRHPPPSPSTTSG